MNFGFSKQDTTRNLSPEEIKNLARWEKQREDGKWFWIFKRAASWLLSIILLLIAANFFGADLNLFHDGQFLIVFCMMGGYVVSSIFDWTKMEEKYQIYLGMKD